MDLPLQGIRPSEATGDAWNHMKKILFEPFDIGKWFILGFLTFLQMLSSGGASFNFPFGKVLGNNGESGLGLPDIPREYMPFAIVGVIILAILFLALFVLFQWLGSRGGFCYLHCIRRNVAEVKKPWKEFHSEANSFFLWRFGLIIATSIGAMIILSPIVILAISMSHGDQPFDIRALVFSSVFLLNIIPFITFIILIGAFFIVLTDFVMPIQMIKRIPFGPAIRLFWILIKATPGAFLVYLLLRVVLAVAVWVAVCAIGLATCCIGFCLMILPVIGHTILQPWFAFIRAWPLYVLRQFGPDYDIFPAYRR